MDLSPLFAPFTLAGLALRNRIVMAPMTRRMSAAMTPGPDVAAYYRRRAEGGVGLIVTEGTTVDHAVAATDMFIPSFHGEALAGWKRVADEVHAAGGKIMPQLWHLGMQRRAETSPRPELPSMGPSGLLKPGKPLSAPMTESDIADVIDAFARGAADAKALGFDGIELHGAHGYLIDQFFWEGTNIRTDRWGGDLVRRTRFAVELIRTVRWTVGAEFPVILRWSQWKTGDYDTRLVATPDELAQFLAPLADAGVSAFHCSTRRFWEPEFPSTGSQLNLAGWTKKLTGLPTIAVGSVGLSRADSRTNRNETIETSLDRLSALAAMLARGDFDLVAVGRALLSNPDWPRLIETKQFERLQPYSAQVLESLV